MDVLFRLNTLFKKRSTPSPTIDNNVFKLHYKATSIILLTCGILVTTKQYVGDPIDCISRDDIPPNLLDTYCWIHTTFSLPDAWEKKVGVEIPYPGVDKHTKNENRVYHAYYQWVCFMLFFQAMLFYVPRYFWKCMEGDRIKHLILGLNSPILPEETKNANRKLLVDNLTTSDDNAYYYTWYIIAEILNFVNVVSQIFLVNAFLGGEFTNYGWNVLKFTEWDQSVRYDPMIRVFPRLTKCTFHRYGSSGDVQRHDALCILPINIINEKIYVFLWFWFVILAFVSGLVLVYRATIIVFPRVMTRLFVTNRDYLKFIMTNKCKLGDWFLLNLLSKNLDTQNFRDVINDWAARETLYETMEEYSTTRV